MNTRSEQLIGATPSPLESAPTLDISLAELESRLGFKIPDISLDELENKLGFKMPDISLDEIHNDSDTKIPTIQQASETILESPLTSRPENTKEKEISTLKEVYVLPAIEPEQRTGKRSRNSKLLGFIATTATLTMLPSFLPVNKSSPERTTQAAPSATTEAALSTTTTSIQPTTTEAPALTIPMAERPLEIIPAENFLTPEGNFVREDFRISIPAIDADIMGFMQPEAELDQIGQLDQTVIDTLVPAQNPTRLTPQIEAYKQQNPNFIPTAERTKRDNGDMWYWGNKTAGEFQKTGIFSHESTVYPGQSANSVMWMHGSTKTAGGGDLPALKQGDELEINRNIDGNKYTFAFVEREIIDVDEDGALTAEEKIQQIERGYGEDVNAGRVIQDWLNAPEGMPTFSIVICSDKDGTPGGRNGQGAGEARAIYRFALTNSEVKMTYPAA